MTKRSTPYEPRETSAAVQPVKSDKKANVSDRQRLGGRPKGKANYLNQDTHRAILDALAKVGHDIGNPEIRDGLIAFIYAAVKEDYSRGIKLITAITPRMLDIKVEKNTTVQYKTVEEIQEDLEKRGIKPLREIFRVDYVGDKEPVEAEIIPSEAKQDLK